eukprot:CAMPEP_0197032164 /NCGR_PEP_ID=MMETSP1384-20130603/10906_1 /TAXON_ID=29189 /ORGANISM="Ammonia sp." /LENGTH=505 /DNA_ID=CAMNT_0042461779 /DNA_START=6 /DNA_END=1520 /DNA_ORIENTATION=-
MNVDFIPLDDSDDDDDDLLTLSQDWIALPTSKRAKLQFISTKQALQTTPWKDWSEFESVYHHLFHHYNLLNQASHTLHVDTLKFQRSSLANLQHACDIIAMWRSRSSQHFPTCVDATQQLMHTLYLSSSSAEAQRRLLALAISRTVNRLLDASHSKSAVEWSMQLNFPLQIVQIRHEIVHHHLPSLQSLKQHAMLLLNWLNTHYWQFQLNKVSKICNANLKERVIKFRNEHNKNSEKQEHQPVIDYLQQELGANSLAVMKYFVPLFIDECLVHLESLSGKNTNNIGNDAEKIIPELFTCSFVKYNSLIRALFELYPRLIAHLALLLLQKRCRILTDINRRAKGMKAIASGSERIVCGLMVGWSASLVMDEDYHSLWSVHFAPKEIVFVFQNALKYASQFNDELSMEMVRNLKKKAIQLGVNKDMHYLRNMTVLQNYVEPLWRNARSDASLAKLMDARSEARKLDEKLLAMTQQTNRMNHKQVQDEDEDEDDEDVDVEEEIAACKW